MIVVGEASGDSHAAKVVESLRKMKPDAEFEFFGTTGKKLREAGVETIVEADEFAIVGLPEVAKAIPMFLGVFKKVRAAAIARKPDAVILVDFPDFNLTLAKSLKKRGFKVIFYISPQVWAWKKYRAKTIKKYVDLLLAILPFEKDWYAKKGVGNVKYVGNPLAGEVRSTLTREDFCEKHDLDKSRSIVALLSGSRQKETERILPVLIETACAMNEKDEDLQFVIALASTRKISEVESVLDDVEKKGLKLPESIITVQHETYEAIAAADAAAVTSGTATLETAILGTPLVVVYKSSEFNAKVLRPLISVEFIGLVNLVSQEEVAKELVQEELTVENLSGELFRLLEKSVNKKMRERLFEVKKSLGDGGAADRVAEAIFEELA